MTEISSVGWDFSLKAVDAYQDKTCFVLAV